jgi:competence protein ComEC
MSQVWLFLEGKSHFEGVLSGYIYSGSAMGAMHTESTKFGQGLDRQVTAPLTAGLSQIPLFHAAWLFAFGITVAHWLFLRPSLVLVALPAVAVLCALAAWRAQRTAWLPLAILWCLLGVWCAQMEPHPAPAPALAALSDGLLRTVEGTVVDAGPMRYETEQNLDEPTAANVQQRPSQRIDLRVSSLEVVTDTADAQTPAAGRVRLTIRWPSSSSFQISPRAFQCGDQVRATVRLLQPETYHDPGVWSREDFLLDQGITSTATVSFDQVERFGHSAETFIACRLGFWQHISSTRLLALPTAMRRFPSLLRLSTDDAAMLAAMVAGDRTYLTQSLRVGFERTGSFHMLVVSGFHLAIVAACVFWVT